MENLKNANQILSHIYRLFLILSAVIRRMCLVFCSLFYYRCKSISTCWTEHIIFHWVLETNMYIINIKLDMFNTQTFKNENCSYHSIHLKRGTFKQYCETEVLINVCMNLRQWLRVLTCEPAMLKIYDFEIDHLLPAYPLS